MVSAVQFRPWPPAPSDRRALRPAPYCLPTSSSSNREYRLQLDGAVAMDALKPSVFGETLRHIDNLLAESRHLRKRIAAAIHREREPFYPERRYRYESHEPERRKHP